jgi:glycine amidinotransferase
MDPTPVVNSHNDWDPLEEVVVGTPYHLDYEADVSFRLFFVDNLSEECYFENADGTWQVFGEKPSEQLREESQSDLEEFVAVLREEHVEVRRPDPLTEVATVKTPYWSTAMSHAMMSRDLFMVVADEIIETPPMVRSRYFEPDLYKRLFTEYFRRGARWVTAPKSRLCEESFDYSYALARGYTSQAPERQEYEMMFDGAQVLRLGRDLLFNCSTENHRMGLRWLARHLGDGYRVHEIAIADHHIDAKLVALGPGTLLVHASLDMDALPAELSSWDRIVYRSPEDSAGAPDVALASEAIGMNVLSLDERKVVVEASEKPLIEDLERAGFTPIPCRWRHARALGGSFHCMTLDVRRRGGPESYLG